MRKFITVLPFFMLTPLAAAETATCFTREFAAQDIKAVKGDFSGSSLVLDEAASSVKVSVSDYSVALCTAAISLRDGVLTVEIKTKNSFTAAFEESCHAAVNISAPARAASLDLQSVSGDITINTGADLRAETVSGSIAARGVTGSVVLRSNSGDISGVLADTAQVKTDSGKIDLAWSAVPAKGIIEAKSMSGDVALAFPASAKGDVSGGTMSGDSEIEPSMLD
ncbi:MAG: DUF4097 family beta strand repeat-containing protein, partial [Elusimicrobiaceae bacterium]